MKLPGSINAALDQAWNRDVAANSAERWQALCEREGWGGTPGNLSLLVRIFGASWYFTRFIFVNGREASALVNEEPPAKVSTQLYTDALGEALAEEEQEQQLDRLRHLKNRCMLQILIAVLEERFNQEQCEYALTCLAEATLGQMMRIFQLDHPGTGARLAILGMGRMAGREMTFGSDLDLIFLYGGDGSDMDPGTERGIRQLLRHIALQTPQGALYDVDMRLRPHGNAGVLVTSFASFLEYHSRERDIWERQMMTRCRAILDDGAEVAGLMKKVARQIFAGYEEEHLRSEIVIMRQRVLKELGSPAGKFEIKRGRGGIMDIDFITHYLQLAHGHGRAELQTASTREVLRRAAALELVDAAAATALLEAYDFLKRVEMSLRLFDLKPISAFPSQPGANAALAKALGYREGEEQQFIDHYRAVTDSVRDHFNAILKT